MGNDLTKGLYYGMMDDNKYGISGNTLDFKDGGITGAYQGGKNFGNFGSNGGLLDDLIGGDGFGDIVGGAKGLWDMYAGYKNMGYQDDLMDMYKEQLGMQKDKWQLTKDELAHVNATKNATNAGYGGYGSVKAKTYGQYA